MIRGELRSKVDCIWETMWPGGIANPLSVIDQYISRGVMVETSVLYEPPFSNVDAHGPDALFQGKENVIDGIFQRLKDISENLESKAG